MRNWQTGLYDVYQLPNPPMQMADPAFCLPGVRPTAIGVDIGSAVCPLPLGARKVNTSAVAYGSIARIGNGVPATSGANIGAGVGGLGATGLGGLGAIRDAVVASVVAAIVSPIVVALFRRYLLNNHR